MTGALHFKRAILSSRRARLDNGDTGSIEVSKTWILAVLRSQTLSRAPSGPGNEAMAASRDEELTGSSGR